MIRRETEPMTERILNPELDHLVRQLNLQEPSEAEPEEATAGPVALRPEAPAAGELLDRPAQARVEEG